MKNLAVTLLIVLFPLFVFAQDEVSFEIETPIGIEGCSSIADISFSPNSEIIMVACSSTPRGLYYSRDGGATWTFARGGAYQYGSGVSIRMTDTLAFAS
ncbi:MAG: hypothetical protein KDD55_03595, partial [Bdellovibrionales bacterium]|nr:hypothetical protein [Bdellovibrionales bacterium]